MKRVVILLTLVVLAGCASATGTPTPTHTPQGTTVTVVDAADGDTITVRFASGATDIVRLLGVDTPEVHGDNNPAEFEGVRSERCLQGSGENASRFVKGRLIGEEVRLVQDPVGDKRGYYGRMLAYVYHDGENINRLLIKRGLARVYDSEFSKVNTFYELERNAQAEDRGVWSC